LAGSFFLPDGQAGFLLSEVEGLDDLSRHSGKQKEKENIKTSPHQNITYYSTGCT